MDLGSGRTNDGAVCPGKQVVSRMHDCNFYREITKRGCRFRIQWLCIPGLTLEPPERSIERYPVRFHATRGRRFPQRLAMPTSKLFTPRDAAQVIGISYPTLKQWIYKKKISSVKTAGGHHRIPEKEVDRFLYRANEGAEVSERGRNFRRISGRNQLVGRVTGIKAQRPDGPGDHVDRWSAHYIDHHRRCSSGNALKRWETVAALIKSTEVMIIRL